MNFDNTYVKIDLDAIESNIDAIRAKVGVNCLLLLRMPESAVTVPDGSVLM